jgi:hypothetical protein
MTVIVVTARFVILIDAVGRRHRVDTQRKLGLAPGDIVTLEHVEALASARD